MMTIRGATGAQLEYPGTIAAAQNTDVAFEVSGQIVEFPVKEGQDVVRGDLIARLDPRDYQSQRDAAVAQRQRAKADYDRYQELYANNSISLLWAESDGDGEVPPMRPLFRRRQRHT